MSDYRQIETRDGFFMVERQQRGDHVLYQAWEQVGGHNERKDILGRMMGLVSSRFLPEGGPALGRAVCRAGHQQVAVRAIEAAFDIPRDRSKVREGAIIVS